jgi:hypothetical protein
VETERTGPRETQAAHASAMELLVLAAAGAAAFWMTDLAMAVSPIAAEYKAAFSISSLPVALAEALAGGVIIAFCISLLLSRFYNRIPGREAVLKSLILSFLAMATIELLSALADPGHASVFLLTDTWMNAPRFLALGTVIGLLYGGRKGGA